MTSTSAEQTEAIRQSMQDEKATKDEVIRKLKKAVSAVTDATAAFLREAAGAHEALAPFAAVAEHDIGESESDADLFRPMSAQYARAPLLTVGDLRRAKAIISAPTTPAAGGGE